MWSISSFAAFSVIFLLRITEYAVNLLNFCWLHVPLDHHNINWVHVVQVCLSRASFFNHSDALHALIA